MGRMTYGRSMVAGTIAAAAVATALTAGPAAAQPAAKGQSAQQTARSVQIKGTRHTTNRNVELVIGTSASGSRVKLGTVTVELEDVLGHAGARLHLPAVRRGQAAEEHVARLHLRRVRAAVAHQQDVQEGDQGDRHDAAGRQQQERRRTVVQALIRA